MIISPVENHVPAAKSDETKNGATYLGHLNQAIVINVDHCAQTRMMKKTCVKVFEIQ